MKTSKLLAGTLFTAAIIFLLDYLWYGVIMKDYFTSEMREMPLWPWYILGLLAFSLAFAYIYPKGYEGHSDIQQGLRYGFWVWLLTFVPAALIGYATTGGAPLNEWLVDMFYRLFLLLLAGVGISYIIKMGGGLLDRGGPKFDLEDDGKKDLSGDGE